MSACLEAGKISAVGCALLFYMWGNFRIKEKVYACVPLPWVSVHGCVSSPSSTWLHSRELLMHSMFLSREACMCVCACVCEGERVRFTINTIDLFTLVPGVQGQLSSLPLETLKLDY